MVCLKQGRGSLNRVIYKSQYIFSEAHYPANTTASSVLTFLMVLLNGFNKRVR